MANIRRKTHTLFTRQTEPLGFCVVVSKGITVFQATTHSVHKRNEMFEHFPIVITVSSCLQFHTINQKHIIVYITVTDYGARSHVICVCSETACQNVCYSLY